MQKLLPLARQGSLVEKAHTRLFAKLGKSLHQIHHLSHGLRVVENTTWMGRECPND